MPELGELTRAAVEAAQGDEAVEAFAEEGRTTEASALRAEVEGLTFAEQRGVGVRLISSGRLGYAWAADPSLDEVRQTVRRARENAALDAALAADGEFKGSIDKLIQGPLADALTHVGQLAMLRGMAGAPVRPESYARAAITAGRVGLDQEAPRAEFDGDASMKR